MGGVFTLPSWATGGMGWQSYNPGRALRNSIEPGRRGVATMGQKAVASAEGSWEMTGDSPKHQTQRWPCRERKSSWKGKDQQLRAARWSGFGRMKRKTTWAGVRQLFSDCIYILLLWAGTTRIWQEVPFCAPL